jgi:hypothetical protein
MKIFIEHDSKGKLFSAGFSTNADMKMSLKPRPRHKVAEIDVEEIRTHKDYKNLTTIVQTCRVQTVGGTSKLIRKSK